MAAMHDPLRQGAAAMRAFVLEREDSIIGCPKECDRSLACGDNARA